MNQDQLIKRLMAVFLDELEEHIQAYNRDVLALTKDTTHASWPETLKNLFRTVHSLKGAARSVNLSVIEQVCHQLEEITAAAQEGRRTIDADLFTLLFATADAFEESAMRLREQHDLNGGTLDMLLPQIEAAAAGGTAITPRQPIKKAAERSGTKAPPSDRKDTAIPGDPENTSSGSSPASTPEPSQTQPSATSAIPAATSVAMPEPLVTSTTLRVTAEKLDTLLARSGEMLVARRRLQSRSEDLLTLRESLSRWKAEWRKIENPLEKCLKEAREANRHNSAFEAVSTQQHVVPRKLISVLSEVGSHIRQLEKDIERVTAALISDSRQLDQVAGLLDEEVRRVRMLPFAEACQGLERIVYDLAQLTNKQVELIIEGGDVELDRSVLEGLKDPLRHLIRNAVDHGVDPPGTRLAAGKPARAKITVSAVLHGAQVHVAVSDDGSGIALKSLRQQVRKKNLPEPSDDRELAMMIFHPGLSTARKVTDVSGRGVGLDVVKSRIEALHGTVDLMFSEGRGSRFTLAVPLTLTTLRALLVTAGGQTFAFVGTNVQKLVRVNPADFRSIEGRPTLSLGDAPMPVAGLAETLGMSGRDLKKVGGRFLALIVAAGDGRMAFLVDDVLAEQEIVVKSLGSRIRRMRHLAGGTILPSGRIALVLNAASVVRTALTQLSGSLTKATVAGPVVAKKRLLLAEDSVTIRTLEKSILEAAGYDVTVAVNGAEAWELLQESGADLLVSDVDMPLMDGFALAEAIRGSERFRNLPVVLVTARETAQDKARGAEIGADAYLVKSAFDQTNLLETIAQLS